MDINGKSLLAAPVPTGTAGPPCESEQEKGAMGVTVMHGTSSSRFRQTRMDRLGSEGCA